MRFGVVGSPADGAATGTVHQVERNSEVAIDEWRSWDTTLGERTLFREREGAELAYSFALAEHGARGFDLSCTAEPLSVGAVGSVRKDSSVLGPDKVGDSEDAPRLSRSVQDRNLDYIITFVDPSGQRAFGKECRRGKRCELIDL